MKEDSEKTIEKEICAGNPVLLRVAREASVYDPKTRQTTIKLRDHTVIATGTTLDSNGKLSFIVNDPSRNELANQNISLEKMAVRTDPIKFGAQYKYFIGYDHYVQAADPAMISITSSNNIDFIIVDPSGRRVGYDPTTNSQYNEIPGSIYFNDASDANHASPDEVQIAGNIPNINRLFANQDVLDGEYQLLVFPTQPGVGNISIYKTDADGYTNDREEYSLSVATGITKTLKFSQNHEPLMPSNLNLRINSSTYRIINTIEDYFALDRKNNSNREGIQLNGEIELLPGQKIAPPDSIEIAVGGKSGFKLPLLIANFKRRSDSNSIQFELENSAYKITINESGQFAINLKSIDLSAINPVKWGQIDITINGILGRTTINLQCKKNSCSGESK